jgi:Carboxypeptidase regulatory-like domain
MARGTWHVARGTSHVYDIPMRVQARTVALVATVLLAATGLSTAVTAQRAPARQASQTRRPAGSGSIAGAVTSDADGKPLTRARVVIRSAALAQARVALTDSKGIFTFEALPAGVYEVAASRTGFALPNAAGGPARGVQVRLGEGESRAGVNLALQRAGTIPGRLLDEDGTPLSGADVEALSLRAAEGQQLTVVASARTDDRGDFRLAGLPAGQYFVVARDPAFTNVGDESGALRYAPTYHPGVFSPADAQPVTVAAGQESPRVEFQLHVVRPARVNGTISTPEGRPLLGGAVLLIAKHSTFNVPLPADDVEFLPDGRFSLRNIPAGRYLIRARAEIDPRQVMWFASFSLNVEGRDVEGVAMVLAPGASVAGRLDWTPKPAAPGSGATIRVRAPFADGSGFGDSLTGQVAPNGTFQIRGVMAGSHYFTAEGLADPWVITEVLAHGRNVLDQPTNVQDGEQLHDIRLVVSRGTAELRGVVLDGGRPSIDALVVTTAPPPAVASAASPRFRATRTDKDGRYRLTGLPVGNYRIAAVAGMDELVARRHEWLARLSADGIAVTIASEGGRTLDLTALQGATLAPVAR